MKENTRMTKVMNDLDLSVWAGQMSVIIGSGLSVDEGIRMMKEDADDLDEIRMYDLMMDAVAEEGLLSVAMTRCGGFPSYMIHMVQLGEITGHTEQVLASLEKYYARQYSLKESIRSAIVYPLVLSIMMMAVIVVLLVAVMPVFQQVYRELGTELSGVGLVLIQIGEIIRNSGLAVIIILAILVLALWLLNRTRAGQAQLKALWAQIPGNAARNHSIAACRFADVMSLAFAGGSTTEEALDMAADMNDDPVFGDRIKACQSALAEGDNLSESLHKSGIFNSMYTRMISIGLKTGNVEHAMEQVATGYQEDVDQRTNRRLAKMEPILIGVLSLAVAVVLLSVMFPLLGVMSAM